jgi:hypothetical protein
MKRSTFTVTLSVPSTPSTVTTGPAFELANAYSIMGLVVTILAPTDGALHLYIQDSTDDGVTWTDCAHFAQNDAGTARVDRMSLMLWSPPTPTFVGEHKAPVGDTAPAPGLAEGTVCPAPWGQKLRLVAVTGPGTSGAPVVQTVKFMPVVLGG